ncbi:MAG TPA: acetylxylan esterase [Galbitalea sp.]|nr:acetylxylan esterase [Galbitalea sp.]
MAFFDLSPEELERYAPDLPEPADLDQFWSETISAAREAAKPPTMRSYDSGLALIDVWDVTFAGFGGDPVDGWLMVPRGADEPLPMVVEFLGYGGGRGLPHEHLAWPAAGYAHFVMDTRGQGSGWGTGGSTGDPHGSGPATPGFMTKGIASPSTYYYRRVYTDAVRAIDTARSIEVVDSKRIIVTGVSQGGGISLAAAGLVPDVAAALPDVPFLCHIRRGVAISDDDPYREVSRYLSVHDELEEQTFRTLSYFDAAIIGRRGKAPALFSTALWDTTCPPSTVYAARNTYGGAADIDRYTFNGHDGGRARQWARQRQWLIGQGL